MLPDIRTTSVTGKRVLLRLDLDVPLEDGAVADDTRLQAGLETLYYLLNNNATVFVVGHLGRPKGIDKNFSLLPVAQWFLSHAKEQLAIKETTIGTFPGWQLAENFFLLENIRFYDGEEKNDESFAKSLGSIADIYVNDAFAVSHRAHASIVGVAALLPHFAGLQLQKEVSVLSMILENPKRPLLVIIGGAKLETKLPLVEKMHQLADYVLVGGKIAQEEATLLRVQHENSPEKKSVLLVADLTEKGTDITEKSAENFLQIIQLAQTIVWNGPVGLISSDPAQKDAKKGSQLIAEGISKSNAYKVIGGGDTIDFIRQEKLEDKFDFCSTGGGAMLEFLSGNTLPGIKALEN